MNPLGVKPRCIRYTSGSNTSKHGEEDEPISVTFDTDYCTLWAVVKTGHDLDVQELAVEDAKVTVTAPDRFAINFVEFYCTEDAAQDAAENFPANQDKQQTENQRRK